MESNVDLFNYWYDILDEKTENISTDDLKKIVYQFRTLKLHPKFENVILTDEDALCDLAIRICDRLVFHIREGFQYLDEQILCSSCLYSFINILPVGFHLIYMREVQDFLIQYLDVNYEFETVSHDISELSSYKTLIKKRSIISLISALFNCELISNEYKSDNMNIKHLSTVSIQRSLEIIIRSCLKYSTTTFLSFKTFHIIIEKLLEWKIDNAIIGNLHKSILFVILNSWENAYQGIKDVNSKIFRTYLKYVKNLSVELSNDFFMKPWSKVKYYVFCETVPDMKSINILTEEIYESCVKGLRYSLRNPSYLSAGKDLYKSIIETFSTYEEWQHYFYNIFVRKLSGTHHITKINILNHWLPCTLKKYPNLLQVLLKDLEKIESENSLFPFLFILKLGRKTGQITFDFNGETDESILYLSKINLGILHVNIDIRSQAFEVVCCSSKNTKLPAFKEFLLVQSFLTKNIIEDSTPFRLNVLNSFMLFTVRLRDSFLHNLKYNTTSKNLELNDFEEFFVWIYNFLFKNIICNGNYQRKISSLKIIDIILKHFSQPLTKNINMPRKGHHQKEQGWKVKEYLKSKGKWLFDGEFGVNSLLCCIHDATNDVREEATDILINYYIENSTLKAEKANLFVNGIIQCNSKIFYKVESGKLLFKLLFNFPKGPINVDFASEKKEQDTFTILETLIDKCWEYLTYNKKDLFYSICNNQNLHGILSALSVCLKYCSKYVDNTIALNLVLLVCLSTKFSLKSFSLSCLKKEEDYSPSFAEISESINMIIMKSEFKNSDEDENTHISNSQKLVLNNMWMNLKACSELATSIIEFCYELLSDEDIKKCINVHVSILTRCRHKGAIEAAGLNLGKAVSFITSSDNQLHHELLLNILEKFLAQVLSNNISGASVTRRSAGLTILVHRFVTNDLRHEKPFFFIVTPKLIKYVLDYMIDKKQTTKETNILSENNDMPNPDWDFIDSKNNIEIDLPHARAIHLLCRVVNDSCLSHYVTQYASALSVLCFENITSNQWQLRNAALQLYGALVPKLIGRKGKENDEISCESSTTVDEVFCHMPRFWKFFESMFTIHFDNTKRQKFYAEIDLVLMLNFFSITAKRNSIEFDIKNSHVCTLKLDRFLSYFVKIFESSLYATRKSAAKTIYLFYDISVVSDYYINDDSSASVNTLQGYLLVLKFHLKYFNSIKKYCSVQYLENFNKCFESILLKVGKSEKIKNSYVINSLYLEILYNFKKNVDVDFLNIVNKVCEVYKNINKVQIPSIGCYSWINLNLNMVIENCSEDILVKVVKLCITNFDSTFFEESFFEKLNERLKHVPHNVDLLDILIGYFEKNSIENIRNVNFEILYNLIEKAPNIDIISCDHLFEKYFNGYNQMYMELQCSYLIPFLSILLSKKCISNMNTEILQNNRVFINIVRQLLKGKNCDVLKKLEIVLCLQNQAYIVTFLCDTKYPNSDLVFTFKSEVLSSIFWLLHDEDVDVRYAACKITFFRSKYVTFPNNAVSRILSPNFLRAMFHDSKNLSIQFLEMIDQEIQCCSQNLILSIIVNLFKNENNNIYLEAPVMKENILSVLKFFKS